MSKNKETSLSTDYTALYRRYILVNFTDHRCENLKLCILQAVDKCLEIVTINFKSNYRCTDSACPKVIYLYITGSSKVRRIFMATFAYVCCSLQTWLRCNFRSYFQAFVLQDYRVYSWAVYSMQVSKTCLIYVQDVILCTTIFGIPVGLLSLGIS